MYLYFKYTYDLILCKYFVNEAAVKNKRCKNQSDFVYRL